MDQKDRTLYCGNLSDKVNEELLFELFLQAGPLESVKIPKGRSFGFITFKQAVSVPYAVALMQGLSLFGKEIRLELRSGASSDYDNPYIQKIAAHARSLSCPENTQPIPFNRHHGGMGYNGRNNFRDGGINLQSLEEHSIMLKERLAHQYLNRSFSNSSLMHTDTHIMYPQQNSPFLNNRGLHNGSLICNSPAYPANRFVPVRDNRDSAFLRTPVRSRDRHYY